jgi:FtsP/CotA-like multicopper oxidase with cupredoxin domain
MLRIRQGDELKIRLENELSDPTAIHWHGCRLPNAMDGVPNLTQLKVEAGTGFDYRFKAMDAGTFWYHAPCTLPGQLERGLYGVLVVDEKGPVETDRDIVLIIDDWLLRTGDIATRTNERLRFRLINAAKAQVMRLRFDRHAVRVMAIDGQPAQPFLARDSRVTLGPGNRIDVFLDAVLDPGETASIFLDESGTEKEIARIVYERGDKRRAAAPSEPPPLPANSLPERIDMRNAFRVEAAFEENATSKTWVMVTGNAPDQFGPPLFSVKRGRAVVMAFPNRDNFGHAIHLHGHHVRLLDNLDDGWKPFWLDTVMVGARQTARIAFVADNPGKWMIYAQRLEHPEIGMTAWFEVT